MKRLHIWILVLCSLLTVATGCRKLVGPTNVTVIDNNRHYVPILQGEILRMVWLVRNDGPHPLVIEQVQPACSAITLVSTVPDVIIPGDSIVMIFDFDTDKNINLTEHCIRLFGNIEPEGCAEMVFDVNIVRGTIENLDYEERFFARNEASGMRGDKKIRESAYDIIPATTVTYAITFDENKAELRPESMPEIEHIARLMKNNPHISFEVQGHTDSKGSDQQNQILSQRRAEAIVSTLVRLGVPPARLTAVGMGSRKPIADNATEEGRALNRRVELIKK